MPGSPCLGVDHTLNGMDLPPVLPHTRRTFAHRCRATTSVFGLVLIVRVRRIDLRNDRIACILFISDVRGHYGMYVKLEGSCLDPPSKPVDRPDPLHPDHCCPSHQLKLSALGTYYSLSQCTYFAFYAFCQDAQAYYQASDISASTLYVP